MSSFDQKKYDNACNVPDGKIKVGTYFNFKDDTFKQRRQVSWISSFHEGIFIIDHVPEFTPVASHSMFKYGSKELIIHKY